MFRPWARRRFLAAAAAVGAAPLLARRPLRAAAQDSTQESTQDTVREPAGFGFADVRKAAKALAAEPFVPVSEELPEPITDLTYDEWRKIRFRPERALWREEGLPFQLQFFHRGWYSRAPVRINVIEQGVAAPVPYRSDFFDYEDLPVDRASLGDLGFAGFRVHHPLNRPDVFDEVIVFLGASYFRAVGRGTHFGISARGLAIDTGLAKGEEFPIFREFWIEKPAKDSATLNLFALLDSPSVAGAYAFELVPGDPTVLRVRAELTFRNPVEKLGIAPLTSMFLHGENSLRRFPDFRPEVHDSDGLAINAGTGEWIWRPLVNPEGTVNISAFIDTDPRGFGLLQRDRDFANYQDLGTLPHQRPSTWVTPDGAWGKGAVELVEIDAPNEYVDNIVAFWVPERQFGAGEELALAYSVAFGGGDLGAPPGGRAVATRIGASGDTGRWRFVIDFVGGQLDTLPDDAPVEAVVQSSKGKIVNVVAMKNTIAGGWRAFFELAADSGEAVELRGTLRLGGSAYLTETWIYRMVVP